ncbi:MAG: beta-galactosidase [Candidatus Brocadiia bacterium]
MRIGVAYYPEHWTEDRWPEDARLMREAGIDVVRVGEFAWSRLEPRRGHYDMDWLGRAMDVLAEEGLEVILCTPTAAPPTWLFDRHPTMFPEDREGKSWYMGSRRHACLNNRPYRRYVRRIVRELAKTLGNRPEICAWQVDNEIGCHGSGRCYCDDCEQAFREWLKRRYGTIDRLNRLWGTAFWSQEFNDWHYIPAPRRTPAGVHPSLALDYERFTSASYRDFFNEQRELIEEYSGADRPITTNCMALHTDQVNQFAFAASHDVAAYDNYPVTPAWLDGTALALDLTRSAKGTPFWVLEQQAGPTLIPASAALPAPGQLRLWSWQAAAHGAELIAYFRWRTCAAGQEMHWYGLLEADGSRRRRFGELAETISGLKEAAPAWEGHLPDARVALVLDYESMWALRADAMGSGLSYRKQVAEWHALLRRRGLAVDVVPPERRLEDRYDVLVVPAPLISRPQVAKRWMEFVERGGRLLVAGPAGYRTEHNTWVTGAPPADYADLLGLHLPEHDVFASGGANTIELSGETFDVDCYCGLIEPSGIEVLGTYGQRFYSGTPAVTRSGQGRGAAYYLGAVGGPDLYGRVLDLVLEDAGLEAHPWAGEALEVGPLSPQPDGARLTFVLNHSADARELELPEGVECTDLLTQTDYSGAVPLDGYGVVLLRR